MQIIKTVQIIETAHIIKLVLLLVCLPAHVWAQDYLLDSRVKIQRHDKRNSSHQFPRGTNTAPLDLWAMQFERSSGSEEAEASQILHYEALPPCTVSEVKLIDVQHHTKGTEKTDVLYYAPDDPKQARSAERYQGFAVAYDPAVEKGSNGKQPDYWQMFARFIQIECLPARFRFSYIGSKRYMEYRFGEEAWQE